jgi:antitoxin ParD1/3/4
LNRKTLAIFAIDYINGFMTTTMNISLPESLKSFVDERVKSRGYGSHSEYLRDLVRKDELEAAKEKMRALLMEGLNSAPGRSWGELKSDLLLRAESQRSK